jgi:hypothetical protein
MSDWKGPEMDGDPPLDVVREQRVGVRTALDGLERALAAPSVGRAKEWCAAVRERADALSDAFAIHVLVTECDGGLFDDVLAHAPRLANQVIRLRDEHHRITAGLAAVGDAAAGLDPDGAVDAVRDGALQVMGAIVRHRNAGSSLLYEAYYVDIDAAD